MSIYCSESFKRLILLDILLSKKSKNYSNRQGQIWRFLLADSSKYIRLAEMIEENNTEQEKQYLLNFLRDNVQFFQEEKTLSLVKQVLDFSVSNVIMKTTQTYERMSIQEIADKIPTNLFGFKADKKSDLVPLTILQLTEMNSDKIISSKINDEKKTVVFSEE